VPCALSTCSLNEDEVVTLIERRISLWTHLPQEHGEPLEVLRYKNNQVRYHVLPGSESPALFLHKQKIWVGRKK
jgi:hypothetical protein